MGSSGRGASSAGRDTCCRKSHNTHNSGTSGSTNSQLHTRRHWSDITTSFRLGSRCSTVKALSPAGTTMVVAGYTSCADMKGPLAKDCATLVRGMNTSPWWLPCNSVVLTFVLAAPAAGCIQSTDRKGFCVVRPEVIAAVWVVCVSGGDKRCAHRSEQHDLSQHTKAWLLPNTGGGSHDD